MLHGLFLVLRSPDFLSPCPRPVPHTPACALASGLALWTWPRGKPSTAHSPRGGSGSRSSLQRGCLDTGLGSPREGRLPETKGRTAWGLVSRKGPLPHPEHPMRSEHPQGGRPIRSVSAGASGTTIGAHSARPVIEVLLPAAGQEGESAALGWYLYMAIQGTWAKRGSVHLTSNSSPMKASRMATS